MSTPECHPAHRLHDVCCASLVGRACRMLHGAWSLFRVRACILSPSAVAVGPPRAHCSGMRRLRRRRQMKQQFSRPRSARRCHLPSSHTIDALACCTGHARPLEPLPPRSCTHTRTYTHTPALWNAPRGVRVGGIQGCNSPALCMRVGIRCHRMHCMRPCALVRLSGCASGKCGTGAHVLVCVVRYHALQTTSSQPLVTPEPH